ncbi:hypothetical protein Tco_0847881 [Tanacetum coccineum]
MFASTDSIKSFLLAVQVAFLLIMFLLVMFSFLLTEIESADCPGYEDEGERGVRISMKSFNSLWSQDVRGDPDSGIGGLQIQEVNAKVGVLDLGYLIRELNKGYEVSEVIDQLIRWQAKPDNEDCNMKVSQSTPTFWVAQVMISRGTSAPTHSAFISTASTNSKMLYSDQSHSTTFTSASSSPAASSNVIENETVRFIKQGCTGDATGDVADDVSNAAAEFALMGISSQGRYGNCCKALRRLSWRIQSAKYAMGSRKMVGVDLINLHGLLPTDPQGRLKTISHRNNDLGIVDSGWVQDKHDSQWVPSKLFTNGTTVLPETKERTARIFITRLSLLGAPFCSSLVTSHGLFGPTSIRSIDHKYYSLVVTDDLVGFLWTKPHNKTPFEPVSCSLDLGKLVKQL